MNNSLNVDVIINNKDDITNKFNNNKLSDELNKYIYDECIGTPLNKEIIININTKFDLNKEDKNKLIDMIRSNYGYTIREEMLYIKYNNIKGVILLIIGIIFILISNLISLTNIFWLQEVLLIISWVTIWEAVYNFIFVETKKKIKIKRLKKLTNCKIKFKSEMK